MINQLPRLMHLILMDLFFKTEYNTDKTGFSKATDHPPTDHRPLTYRPTDPPITDPPTQ